MGGNTIKLFIYVFLGFELVTGASYTNPVVNADHPDPGVLSLPDNAGYVVVSTGVFNGNAYPIMFSTDLVNWQQRGFVFPSGSWPVWATGYMWAPEIIPGLLLILVLLLLRMKSLVLLMFTGLWT